GRIVLRVKVVPDGRRVPISLHDTVLGRDCVADRTDDGAWRCVVHLPWSCTFTAAGDGVDVDVLTPSSSCGDAPERCCRVGWTWFSGQPARPPIRFNIQPDNESHPATSGRALRFAETPRLGSHPMWLPTRRVLLYDEVEKGTPEVFAALQIQP
ncbi:MAG: hypothetical protein ACHREM_19470, partial [Polyangiales bacterium]